MLDAIGMKLQDAPAPRAETIQDSAKQEPAAPATNAATAATTSGGPYYSPVLRLDSETQRTVIQYRDVTTGKVQIQYPSERQLEAYRASLRQRPGEEGLPAEGRTGGTDAEGGRLMQASAALRRVQGAAGSGPSLEGEWNGRSSAGLPDRAERPAPRLTAITA